ncbi:MAG TPA: glycosyltransferase [Terriglobales bacterium]|nr:glycosyltransferase [Terriglobales bacterium]
MTATSVLWNVLLGIAVVGVSSSTIFLVMVLVAAVRWRRGARAAQMAAAATPESSLPAVTIFKPVHGMEARLEENLESFFRQDYPAFEVVLGARDAGDAGLQVAEKIRQRHPQVKSRIVVSGAPTWPNAKVFSLSKMIPLSANDYFVISDSDVRVSPSFLRDVIPGLLEARIGLVTCPYRGVPAGDIWSTLEALGMSVEMPSGVMVADMLEGIRFALGPAVALRRDALDKIGGIAVTADYYSDDFVLGNLIWAAGYKVIFSHHIIQHVLTPRSLTRTLGDQLRWMKSTRFSRPLGHVGTGLTYAVPFGILGLVGGVATGHWGLGVGLFSAALMNRVVQSAAVGWGVIGDRRALFLSWLYPVRDLLGFLTWVGSFGSRTFFWRGETYRFSKGGRIIPNNRPAESAVGAKL